MLFNQQQCFIYSTASFLSKLRAKKVEKLRILVIKQLQQMTLTGNFENEIPEKDSGTGNNITYMKISRYAIIDKFVNIRYIFLLARRAYSWLFQLAQMWKLLALGVGLGDLLTPALIITPNYCQIAIAAGNS
jgi:hypothetical protein